MMIDDNGELVEAVQRVTMLQTEFATAADSEVSVVHFTQNINSRQCQQ